MRVVAERQATAFSLPQDYKNLGFAISCHLHQNLLMHPAEKILFPHPLTFGGLPTHSITWVRDKWHSAEQFETNMLAAKKNENRP